MSVRVLSARTRSERRSCAFPGSVINSCLMNLTHPRLIILGNSSTKGQKMIKSCRRAGILPSRHTCEAIERVTRSEEHTSELQSLAYLVCRLLLEKKKQN